MERHKVFIICNNKKYFYLIKDLLKSLNLDVANNINIVRHNHIKNLNSYHEALVKDIKIIVYNDDINFNNEYIVASCLKNNLVKYLVAHCLNHESSPNILYLDSDIDNIPILKDFFQLSNDLVSDKSLFLHSKVSQKVKNILDEKLVLSIADGLCQENIKLSNSYYGNKNLIYFSIFGADYIKLLENCLCSIHYYTPIKSFDLLFICDRHTHQLLSSLNILKYFNCYYHIVNDIKSATEASMQKCKIFDFKDINNYNNILFLDCDVLCLQNANNIFDDDIHYDYIYVSHFLDITDDAFKSVSHSLCPLSDNELENLKKHNQKPFNAGQFLFKNSERMKKHFETILWMINNWSGYYFFEQSFLVTYFTRNLLSDSSLAKKIIVNPISFNYKYKKYHNNNTIFIHFCGLTAQSFYKMNYIKKYCTIHHLHLQ